MNSEKKQNDFLILKDKKRNCFSIIFETTIERYMNLVEKAYKSRGGLEYQRAPLKTSSALEIRKRMVHDISEGSVIPPVVIGVVVSEKDLNNIDSGYFSDKENILTYLEDLEDSDISIIDGMQRTTALSEAISQKSTIGNNPFRVEIWLSDSVNPLIYRMLILNTGQIPWDITRQLDTIYSPLIKKIKERVPDITIYTKDDTARRSSAGEYQSSHIVELYMIFSTREVNVNVKNKLQTDFSKLNVIESVDKEEFFEAFINALSIMVNLDALFSKVTVDVLSSSLGNEISITDWKVKCGQDIFKSAPARAGFIAAFAEYILDEAGFDINWTEVPTKLSTIKTDLNKFIEEKNKLSPNDLAEFMYFDLLNEKLSYKTGKIGEYERELYLQAFSSMLKNINRLSNMKPCWAKK